MKQRFVKRREKVLHNLLIRDLKRMCGKHNRKMQIIVEGNELKRLVREG